MARRDAKLGCAALAFAACALVAATARAAPTARLVYVRSAGAEACPDEEAIRAAVAARLGYDPFRAVADTTLSAEVRRGAGGFSADVKLVDGSGMSRGARHLTSGSDDCADLTHAMALSMSIALDPLSLMRPAPPASSSPPAPASPTPEPTPPSVPPPDAPAPAAPAPALPSASTPAPVTFHVGLGPSIAAGASPAPAVGGAAFAGLRWRAFSVDLGVRADLPASHGTEQGGLVRTSLAAVVLAPCAHLGPAFACIAGALGSVTTSATEVSAPKSSAGIFAAAGPRLGAAIPLSADVDLRAYGDAWLVLTPYELRLNDRAVFSSSTVAGSLTVVAVLHFS